MFARLIDRRGRPRGPEIRVSRMGPEGELGYTAELTSAAFNTRRKEYLVVWDGNDTSEARIPCRPAPPGPPVGAPPPPTPGPCYEVETEIYARRLDANGQPIGGQYRISTTGPRGQAEFSAFAPTVVYNRRADDYLVVFSANHSGDRDIADLFLQRLDGSGAEVGSDRRVTRRNSDIVFSLGTVAYNDLRNEYFIVYGWHREAYGQRLTASARKLGRDFRVSAPGGRAERPAALALNRQTRRYMMVFESSSGPDTYLFVRALNGAGRPATRTRRVRGAVGVNPNPDVAADYHGSGYLLAWSQTDPDDTEIYGLHYTARARAADRRPFRISRMGPDVRPPDNPPYFAYSPDVAPLARGAHFVSAWVGQDQDDGGRFELYARTVRR